jgi:hypothetical protein
MLPCKMAFVKMTVCKMLICKTTFGKMTVRTYYVTLQNDVWEKLQFIIFF